MVFKVLDVEHLKVFSTEADDQVWLIVENVYYALGTVDWFKWFHVCVRISFPDGFFQISLNGGEVIKLPSKASHQFNSSFDVFDITLGKFLQSKVNHVDDANV